MPISLAGSGLIVTIISIGAKMLGLDIDDGHITEAVNAGVIVVGFVALVWGQLRRKDLVMGLFRK